MRIMLVEHLLSLLDDHGVLAFSFIDPFFHSWPGEYRGNNFAWRLDRINSSRHIVDVDRCIPRVPGTSRRLARCRRRDGRYRVV
jgi:hypothetical protein